MVAAALEASGMTVQVDAGAQVDLDHEGGR